MATPTDVATRAGVNAFFDLQTAKSVEKAGGENCQALQH